MGRRVPAGWWSVVTGYRGPGAHRDATDPDTARNVFAGFPWRPVAWTVASFAALPLSLLYFTSPWWLV